MEDKKDLWGPAEEPHPQALHCCDHRPLSTEPLCQLKEQELCGGQWEVAWLSQGAQWGGRGWPVLKELLMLGMVERQWQGGCSVDSGLTHKGGMRRVVGVPSGL